MSPGDPTGVVALSAPRSVPEVEDPAVEADQARRRFIPHLAALGGFLAFTAFFYPYAVSHLGSAILSDGADGASFLWSYWQIPHALSNLDNPFSTDLMFHPVGVPLAFHTNTPIESLLIGALGGIIGITLAVNLVMLGAVVASGVGAYLLALHERASRPAAFFAGVVFAFLPARLPKILGHHNLTHAWVLPFGLLALLLLIERPTRRRALVLGGLLGVAFLTDLTLTVFLGIGTAIVLVWHRRQIANREVVVAIGQAAAVGAVISLPLLVSMAMAVARGELDPPHGWAGAHIYSSDLLSWVVPPTWNRLWGSRFTGIDAGDIESLAYPGLVVLLLATVGAWSVIRRRTQTLWIGIAVAFFVLSLGPFLKVGGDSGGRFEYLGAHFSLPLPYFAFHFVPVLNGLRVPGRFSIMAGLALAILAALALTRLAGNRRVLTWVLPAIALAVVAAEFVPVPAPQQSPVIPRPYEQIAADTTERAVLEIPLQWRHGMGAVGDNEPHRDDTIFLYYATRHRHPMVNGMVARLPQRRLDELMSIPVYRQILTLQNESGFTDPTTFTAEDLRRLRIGFIVYHRDRPMPEVLAHVQALGLPVVADDGTVTVWEVPQAAGPTGGGRA